jgi:uncharacterized protein with von Willebrand factor type A (vWA) domain
MEKTLYKIDSELMQLLAAIEEQQGEINEEQMQALAISQYELETKAIDYGKAILQLQAWEKMADEEAKRVNKLKKMYKKTWETLRDNIVSAMERYDLHEVKSATLKVSLRKSTRTIPDDIDLIPKEYKTVKVEVTPDLEAIKAAFKAGEDVPGAHLEERNNLTIK